MRALSTQVSAAAASTSGRPQGRWAAPPPQPLPSAAWGRLQPAGARCQLPAAAAAALQQAPPPPAAAAAAAAASRHGSGGRRRGPPPARVTNERREIFDIESFKGEVGGEDSDWIEVDPESPLPGVPGGTLERSVGLTYEDGLFVEEGDPEAEQYWFSEPPGGWQSREPLRLRKLEIVPENERGDPDDFRHYGGPQGDMEGRRLLEELREGEVLTGLVVANLLFHGAQVDIGAEWDGLLPVDEKQWDAVGEVLAPGTEVQVRVHRVRDPTLFRFPIQLAAVSADIASLVVPPEEHEAPMDLRVLYMRPEEIAVLSEGQRQWTPEKVFLKLEPVKEPESWVPENLQPEDAVQEEEGGLVLSDEEQALMDVAVSRMFM